MGGSSLMASESRRRTRPPDTLSPARSAETSPLRNLRCTPDVMIGSTAGPTRNMLLSRSPPSVARHNQRVTGRLETLDGGHAHREDRLLRAAPDMRGRQKIGHH